MRPPKYPSAPPPPPGLKRQLRFLYKSGLTAMKCLSSIKKPLMLTVAEKHPDNFGGNLQSKSEAGKIFDGEMSMRTLSTTFHHIICKTILDSLVIIKNIIEADDNFKHKLVKTNTLVTHVDSRRHATS